METHEMKLITAPNLILKRKCGPVPVEPTSPGSSSVTFGEDIAPLLTFMRGILGEREAIGIAANQCNVPRKIFLMRRFSTSQKANGDLDFKTTGKIQVVVNPVILERSPHLRIFIEGCLSFPDKQVKTRRPSAIEVGYYDENGESRHELLDGLEAIIFQHEFDHLQGKTMHDRSFGVGR
jgi:peptide deformylase